MADKENEMLKSLRNDEKIIKDAEEAYSKKFYEFVKFATSGECKVQGEDEDGEQ